MTRINSVHARRIWDSRGRPTLEAEITLEDGAEGRGVAPAGASRGSMEATDLRDGGARLGGMDVSGALDYIRGLIAAALIGKDATDQRALDDILIGLDP